MTQWSMKKSLFFLISTTIVTLSLCLYGTSLWKKKKLDRLTNPKYKILSIVQTGPQKNALPSSYFAELLNLSIDAPTGLYSLNLKEATQKLLNSPLIASVKLQRRSPSTLYIDYEARHPMAWLADFKNRAVDETGHVFAIHPFLPPLKIPEIYLGISSFENNCIEGPKWEIAKKILYHLKSIPIDPHCSLQRIDVSQALAPSLGQREVVLFTEEELKLSDQKSFYFPKILRVSPVDFERQLSCFLVLRKTMMKDYKAQVSLKQTRSRFAPRIIDPRGTPPSFFFFLKKKTKKITL